MVGKDILEELVSGLCKLFGENICQIILYGSVARREAAPDSDIDIAIILRKGLTENSREPVISFAAEMDLKYERVFSIIDIEQEKIEKWGNTLPFYKNIKKEGVVLWKAA